MRKNGSRLISFRQYRLTDMFMFALILCVSELLIFFASKYWFKSSADYYVSFLLPIVLIVMMRWGWVSVIYAALGGVLACALGGGSWQSYLSYGIGYCLVALMLLMTKFLGRDKIRGKWYFSLLYVVLGWAAMNFGASAVGAVCGESFIGLLAGNFGFGANGFLSLAAGVVTILIVRKLDGMFEYQKSYLRRLDDERKEKMRRDEYGDEPVEIDEESLSILKRWDDGLGK